MENPGKLSISRVQQRWTKRTSSSNTSMAVFPTDAAYQFDTSYACQADEVAGDNGQETMSCNSPSLVIVNILKLSQFERVRYP